MIGPNERMRKLPPYLFIEIDKKKKRLLQEGKDVINLGVGDPDMPTPAHIVEAMRTAVGNPAYHQYPFGRGNAEFRRAVAGWYAAQYGVEIDPETEVCALIGSKEGIAHFPFAVLDPGDVSLVPEPGYPVYNIGTMLAGGETCFMPLLEENGFLPDLGKIPAAALARAKLLYLNYPNNPTSATAGRDFLVEAIAFCRKHGIILAYDAAYADVYYEEKPVPFLSLPGAREVGIEFHSLSKTFNMTGWRIGWAVGNPALVGALARLKENVDSGVFEAVQAAGTAALRGPASAVEEIRAVYRRRRDMFAEGLRRMGLAVRPPAGAFYFWVRIASGNSIEAADYLLENAHIVSTPGVGFGPSGEGYLRFSMTNADGRIREAIARMEDAWRKR